MKKKTKKKTKKKINKFLKLPLWADLLITIVGVILGIMLTNSFENFQQRKDQRKALELIEKELKNNENFLLDFDNYTSKKYEAFKVLNSYISSNLEILVPIDSFKVFKSQVSPIFETKSFEKKMNNILLVHGKMEIDFRSYLLDGKLSQTMWNSFLMRPDLLSITDFETISKFEDIYSSQYKVNENIERWRKSVFSELTGNEIEREKFTFEWFNLIMSQKILLIKYQQNLFEK